MTDVLATGPVDRSAEIARLKELLDTFAERLAEADLRDQVRSLIPVFHELRSLGCGLLPESSGSARERIIAYLRRYPMTLIEGDELLVISGIGEWARRVRELRVQYGWWIYTGVTLRELAEENPEAAADLVERLGVPIARVRPDHYLLISTEQDRDAAHRWNLLNGIRKQSMGVRAKILAYLRANVGTPVTLEELRYLAGDRSEWARRVRELRTEDGWPIFTRMQGRSDLPVGSYVLDEDKQAPEHDRQIPDDVRVEVLERDGFACRQCGWTREQLRPEDPRKFLELHHLEHHKDGGANTAGNLVTLCNVHHDQVHAGRLIAPTPSPS
ncbi:HNH endonuclease [Brevundimonas sp. TWP2-3-4b1]|uniref:HNH endonuclease n=1 Tax=Brevundimonas sp. TWP2-3-4b1 TaxID=2804580 RepID=UPI003CF94096